MYYDKLFVLFCWGIVYLDMASKKIISSILNESINNNIQVDKCHTDTDKMLLTK